MANIPVNPSVDLVSFNCPYCGALAHQTWYDVYAIRIDDGLPRSVAPDAPTRVAKDHHIDPERREILREYFERVLSGEIFLQDLNRDLYHPPQVENLHLSKCFSCGAIAVWVHERVVHPVLSAAEIIPNGDLSEDIQRDFKEASAILNISPRGAAALLRLCVQKLCMELGEPGRNLNSDIGSLVTKGLDVHVQQALDIVRVVGNNSVHPGQIDLRDDKAIATKLFALVNEIAEELLTRPSRLKALYEQIVPEKDRANIAKRDKQD